MSRGKKTILLVDDSPVALKTYYLLLKRQGHLVYTATDGREGLEKAISLTPDLLVVDRRVPELDCFALLAELRSHEATRSIPAVVVCRSATKEDVSRARELGVADYIIKGQVTLPEFCRKIEETLSTRQSVAVALAVERVEIDAPVQKLEPSPAEVRTLIERAVEKSVEIRPAILILRRLLEAMQDPRAGARVISEVIESDPALATKLLRVANSVAFLTRNPARTLKDAVRRVGLKVIQELAQRLLSIEATTFGENELVTRDGYCRYSFVMAALARTFALSRQESIIEYVFTSGLLRDVGIAFLLQEFAPLYLPVIRRAREEKTNLYVTERDMLGVDHAEVGSMLVQRWRLPAFIGELIGAQGTSAEHASEEAPSLASLLDAASTIANLMGYGVGIPYDEQLAWWHVIPLSLRSRASWVGWLRSIEASIGRHEAIMREAGIFTRSREGTGGVVDQILIVTSHPDLITWPEIVFHSDRQRFRVLSAEDLAFGSLPEVPILYLPETMGVFEDWVKRIGSWHANQWLYCPQPISGARVLSLPGDIVQEHVLLSSMTRSQVPLLLDIEQTRG